MIEMNETPKEELTMIHTNFGQKMTLTTSFPLFHKLGRKVPMRTAVHSNVTSKTGKKNVFIGKMTSAEPNSYRSTEALNSTMSTLQSIGGLTERRCTSSDVVRKQKVVGASRRRMISHPKMMMVMMTAVRLTTMTKMTTKTTKTKRS